MAMGEFAHARPPTNWGTAPGKQSEGQLGVEQLVAEALSGRWAFFGQKSNHRPEIGLGLFGQADLVAHEAIF